MILHTENFTPEEQKSDIKLQLNFLETELRQHMLAEKMQKMYPEGYVFINALYGLSWCELALSDPKKDSSLKRKALTEALYAYDNINSNKAQISFEPSLKPNNGIFYFGWKNYLLSKILTLDTTFANHKSYLDSCKHQCDIIQSILQNNKNPYLQSYSGQSWPADMFVAMASLSNCIKIFQSNYDAEIKEWILNVKDHLDSNTRLIPHSVDFKTGQSLQGARGSSMSLILRMLYEIDPKFALEQFNHFQTLFVTKTFGLPSIREYPVGQYGIGDVDSGPVIFGVGFSGTIVMIGTFALFENDNLARMQYKTINAFGFGNISAEEKKYIFGMLPIADAFIAWGRATELKFQDRFKKDTWRWTIKFHCISFFVISLLWIIYFRREIINKLKKKVW